MGRQLCYPAGRTVPARGSTGCSMQHRGGEGGMETGKGGRGGVSGLGGAGLAKLAHAISHAPFQAFSQNTDLLHLPLPCIWHSKIAHLPLHLQ